MRALFVCLNDPFGVNGGDFATHAYLLAFSNMWGGNVDVVVREGIKPDGSIYANFIFVPERNWLQRFGSLLKGHLHRYVKVVQRRLAEKDMKYDYCVFNNSRVAAGLIKQVKAHGIKIITIHHNVEREIVLGNTSNPLRKALFSQIVVKSERESYLLSDYNLFLTKQDQQTFHRLYGLGTGKEIIIGAFEFKPLPAIQEKKTNANALIFAITGTLCQEQGVDGIRFFFEELFQYLPENAKVIISGRNPTKEIISLCNSKRNIQLVPNPEDMSKIINQADVYICPTRVGGGLKLRVMDGLRLGIPVITHTCSARGYDAFVNEGHVYVFNSKEEFSEKLHELIQHIKDGSLNRNLIRRKYEEILSFEAGLKRMKLIEENTNHQ